VKSSILGLAVFVSAVMSAVMMIGCGGGSTDANTPPPPPGVNVIVTSPTGAAALDGDKTLAITIQVTNDSGHAGVTWTLSPPVGGGSLSQPTATSVTYTPPAGLTSALNATIVATSVSDPTVSASIPVAVYAPLAISTKSSDLATAFANTDYSCYIFGNGTLISNPCQASVTLESDGQTPFGLGPYTWSVSSGALPNGLFLAPGLLPYTQEIVGSPILSDPSTSATYNFSLTVTDSLGDSATVPLTINVALKQLKVSKPTLVSTVPGVPYTPVPLLASGGTGPYTWSLVPGSKLPPGITLTPDGVIRGTPTDSSTTLYQFALRIQDSQAIVPNEAIFPAPASGSSLALLTSDISGDCSATPDHGFGRGQGAAPYAFSFAGLNASDPVAISGSFLAPNDSSYNLAGVEDIVSAGLAHLDQSLDNNASSVTNARGQAVFNPNRNCLNLVSQASSQTFLTTPVSFSGSTSNYQDGRIIGYGSQRGTGVFRLQDPTAFSAFPPATGQYAFRFSGWDVNGGHFAMAGIMSATAGPFTLMADVNDAGVLSGATSGTVTFSSADTNTGRGKAQFSVGAYTLDLVYYVIDSGHLIFSSAATGQPLVTGEATSTGNSFSQASLSDNHIFRLGGALPGGTPGAATADLLIGVLHSKGDGTLSGTSFARSGNTSSTATLSGTYSVDANGRVTFSGTVPPAVGYLISPQDASGTTAYWVGTGLSAASGVMEFQMSSDPAQTPAYPPGFQFDPTTQGYGFGSDEMLDPQSSLLLGHATPGHSPTDDPTNYLDVGTPLGLNAALAWDAFADTWTAEGAGTFGAYTYMVESLQLGSQGIVKDAKFYYFDTSPFNGHPIINVGRGPF
jgi:Putative Ig domain